MFRSPHDSTHPSGSSHTDSDDAIAFLQTEAQRRSNSSTSILTPSSLASYLLAGFDDVDDSSSDPDFFVRRHRNQLYRLARLVPYCDILEPLVRDTFISLFLNGPSTTTTTKTVANSQTSTSTSTSTTQTREKSQIEYVVRIVLEYFQELLPRVGLGISNCTVKNFRSWIEDGLVRGSDVFGLFQKKVEGEPEIESIRGRLSVWRIRKMLWKEGIALRKRLRLVDPNPNGVSGTMGDEDDVMEVDGEQEEGQEQKEVTGLSTHHVLVGRNWIRRGKLSPVPVAPAVAVGGQKSTECEFVVTTRLRTRMYQLCECLRFAVPILLRGSSGSGKSSLIRYVAQSAGQDLATIHADPTLDSRDLIGTYICSERKSGQFVWRDGALVSAMRRGQWCVVEDAGVASQDIIGCLESVVEWGGIYVNGQWVAAHRDFRLLLTETTFRRQNLQLVMERWRKWQVVEMGEVSVDELDVVVATLYGRIDLGTRGLILKSFALLGDEFGRSHQRSVTIRDVLKWCDRISLFVGQPDFFEACFAEGVSLLLRCRKGSSPLSEMRDLVERIGEIWGMTAERVHYLVHLHKSVFSIVGECAAKIGRIRFVASRPVVPNPQFAFTKQSLRVLETAALAVTLNEPTLIVGETGTGKTTIVQFLAGLLHKRLIVQNLNQQTDSSDFVGGYRPVDLNVIARKLHGNFVKLFQASYSKVSNREFIESLALRVGSAEYSTFAKMMLVVCQRSSEVFVKRRRLNEKHQERLVHLWRKMTETVETFTAQVSLVRRRFAFSFVEGSLVKAIQKGNWILLDEVNLASNEILERLSGLLEKGGSVYLTEKGETKPVKRHPEFRIFACMNPPTDVGKKDLPPGIRSKFTRIVIHELLDEEDLKIVVGSYLRKCVAHPPVDLIVRFYLDARRMAECGDISSARNRLPRYTLRTLVRSLQYTVDVLRFYNNFEKALFEGISMAFLTQLDAKSKYQMEKTIRDRFRHSPSFQTSCTELEYLRIGDFFLLRGPFDPEEIDLSDFILTKSVAARVEELARVLMNPKNCSILLEGPTSSGKTSIVRYLCGLTGHKFVRINNHETTDVQEYLGTYVQDRDGRFVFKDGVLVDAVKNGHWIVLDELNLASTDILESLNRLLDDNRELFIPETQEVVRPHPQFKLFATQNPAGQYSGRKLLSRAFKNRFVEIQVEDIPLDEIAEILQKRFLIPKSVALKFVNVMRELQMTRQSTNLFAGKSGFITPRDLFKWANRCRTTTSYEDYYLHGFAVLGERLRNDVEKNFVREVMGKQFRRHVPSDPYFIQDWETIRRRLSDSPQFSSIVWTKSLRRLFSLIVHCLSHDEPVLLVGETGCGKTTICQVFAYLRNLKLTMLNCHRHTETSDFIGSLRPLRHRNLILQRLGLLLSSSNEDVVMVDDAPAEGDEPEPEVILRAENLLKSGTVIPDDVRLEIVALLADYRRLFKWYDGPIVQAMKSGEFFLIDEINLTDDAVIERINSVLESGPRRELLLTEKGDDEREFVVAEPSFRVFATMNPGGDFGKKELSPALRNRFSEIFVPPLDLEDTEMIIRGRLRHPEFVGPMMSFISQTRNRLRYSIRDVVCWIEFINLDSLQLSNRSLQYVHGGDLIILEGIGIGRNSSLHRSEKDGYVRLLVESLPSESRISCDLWSCASDAKISIDSQDGLFFCPPFAIDLGRVAPSLPSDYVLDARTPKVNLLKILRGMQLNRPLLLEGVPGVGKTSMVEVLGRISGHDVVRINLSEQTDMMDLIGCDLPTDDGTFHWCDGIFLDALKKGSWIILDELNLAPQPVLEGLNSVLDYRSEIFVPELNRSFRCSTSFKIFACQNPYQQGSSRKGLPRSFLNRFVKIYIEKMDSDDHFEIVRRLFGGIVDNEMLKKVISFNEEMRERFRSQWEFNLRDILRWCDSVRLHPSENPIDLLGVLYGARLRSEGDRGVMSSVYSHVFGEEFVPRDPPQYYIGDDFLKIGNAIWRRPVSVATHSDGCEKSMLLHSSLKPLEVLLRAVNLNLMCIVTGRAGVGKSCLVETLASLTRSTLNRFPITAATDSVDLLGTFEQAAPRHIRDRIFRLLHSSMFRVLDVLMLRNESIVVYDDFHALLADPDKSEYLLRSLYVKIRSFLDASLVGCIDEEFNTLANLEDSGTCGRFVWTDSVLVRAIEQGEWIALDNVNLCNPTVLDRLNPLFEPNGRLILNERGLLKDGSFKIIHPHPDFRLFMIYDPRFGEISRAMKNRGVEVHVDVPDEQDVRRMLCRSGCFVASHAGPMRPCMLPWSFEDDAVPASTTTGDFPSSYLLSTAFSVSVPRRFAAFLRDGCLLHHSLQSHSDEIERLSSCQDVALEYFFRLATPTDVGARADLVRNRLHQTLGFASFCVLLRHPMIVSIMKTRRSDPCLSQLPLDLRLCSRAVSFSQGQISEFAMISHLWDLARLKLFETKMIESGNLNKSIWRSGEESSVDFGRFFFRSAVELQRLVEARSPSSNFSTMIWVRRLLFSHLCHKTLDDRFIVLWKRFYKLWRGFASVKSTNQIVAEGFPLYDFRSLLLKKLSMSFSVPADRSFLSSLQDLCLTNAEIRRVSLDALFSLCWAKDLTPVRRLLQSIDEPRQKHDSLQKEIEGSRDLFGIRFDEEALELKSLYSTLSMLAELALLGGETTLVKASPVLDLILEFCSSRSCLDLIGLKRLSQSPDRKSLLEVRFNCFRNLFRDDSFSADIYPTTRLKTLLDFLARSPRMNTCSLHSDRIDEVVRFFDAEKQLSLPSFEILDGQSLRSSFEGLLSNLGIETLEDIEQIRALRFFREEFSTVFDVMRKLSKLPSRRLRGHGWVLLSCLRVLLLKPFTPVDPLVRRMMKRDDLRSRLKEIQGRVQELRRIESFKTGGNSNLLIEDSLSEERSVASALETVERKISSTERTQSSREVYLEVFNEMRDFVSSLALPKKIIAMFFEDYESARLKYEGWSRSCDLFLRRFEKRIDEGYYEDILLPFVSAIYDLKYGCLLMLRDSLHSSRKSELSPSEESTIRDLLGLRLRSSSPPVGCDVTEPELRLSLNLLKIQLLRISLFRPFDENHFVEFLRTLFGILVRVDSFLQHAKELDERLVKNRTRVTIIKTDEEILEKELDRFVPDFSYEYRDFLSERELATVKVLRSFSLKDEMSSLLSLVFSCVKREKNANELLSTFESLAFGAVRQIVRKREYFLDRYDDDLLKARIFSTLFDLNSRQKITDDIYLSENVPEVKSCFRLLKRFLTRLRLLQDRFGHDHAILLGLRNLVVRVMSLPVRCPLAKLLTGLELLFERSVFWDDLVSEEFKLHSLLIPLSQFVLKWRKIEIQNWKLLIEKKERHYEKKASHRIWFGLLEKFLSLDYLPTLNTEIIQLLDAFLLGSDLGSFVYRLALLELLAMFVSTQGSLAVVIQNVVLFYRQFVPYVEKTLEDLRAPLVSDLRDFVRIVKWDSLNVVAIRQSMRRTRKRMLKMLQQLESYVLSKEIRSLLLARDFPPESDFGVKIPQSDLLLRRGLDMQPLAERALSIIDTWIIHGNVSKCFRSKFCPAIRDCCSSLGGIASRFEEQKNRSVRKRLLKLIAGSFSTLIAKTSRFRDFDALSVARVFSQCVIPDSEHSSRDCDVPKHYLLFFLYQNLQSMKNSEMYRCPQAYAIEMKAISSIVDKCLFVVLRQFELLSQIRKQRHYWSRVSSSLDDLLSGEPIVYNPDIFGSIFSQQNTVINELNFAFMKNAHLQKNRSSLGPVVAVHEATPMDLFVVGAPKRVQEKTDLLKGFLSDSFGSRDYVQGLFDGFVESFEQVPRTREKLGPEEITEVRQAAQLAIQSQKEAHEKFDCVACEGEGLAWGLNRFFAASCSDTAFAGLSGVLRSKFCSFRSSALAFEAGLPEFKLLVHILRACSDLSSVLESMVFSLYESLCDMLHRLLYECLTLHRHHFYDEDEKEGEGEMSGEVDLNEGGSGFDDGHGTIDASERIENEDQIMSEKDRFDPERDETDERDDDDDMLQPETDFAAPDLEDVDEESGEDEDDMPEMGDVDEQTIDKQLWGDDDDDEMDTEEDDQKGQMLAEETEMGITDELQADEEEKKKRDVKPEEEDHDAKPEKHERKDLEFEDPPDEAPEDIEQQEFVDSEYDDDHIDDEEIGEQQLPDDIKFDDDESDDDHDVDMDEDSHGVEEDADDDDTPLDYDPMNQPLDDESEDADHETIEPSGDDDVEMGEDEDEEDVDSSIDPVLQEEDADVEMTENPPDDLDVQYEEDLQETPYGLHMAGGDAKADDVEEDGEMQTKQMNQGDAGEDGHDLNETQLGNAMQDGREEKLEQEQDAPPSQAQLDMDPLRSLGDSIREWKRKLNIVEREVERERQENLDDQALEFEFKHQGEEDDDDMQALAAADEAGDVDMLEEEEKEEEISEEKEGAEDRPDDDKMDVSEDDAPLGSRRMWFDERPVPEELSQEDPPSVEDDPFQLKDENLLSGSNEIFSSEENRFGRPNSDEDGDLTMLDVDADDGVGDVPSATSEERARYEEIDRRVTSSSQELCEQLRLILEPTVISRLRGDYKTGKRLNMKKIIPYIASDYRKDKIWLRRTKPHQRDYNVILCLDDSESMRPVGSPALDAMVMLCKALQQLEVGKVSVVSFGEQTSVLHPFDLPFSDDAGAALLSRFSFSQRQSLFYEALEHLHYMMMQENQRPVVRRTDASACNIAFILSDGVLSDQAKCTRWLHQIHQNRSNMVVFLLLDKDPDNPVTDRIKVVFDKDRGPITYPILDDFPFPYYVLVRDVGTLAIALADALRQFIENTMNAVEFQ